MTSSLESTYTAPVPEGPPDTGDKPKIALAIAAHPDDADFGCAGTAHLWSQEGWEFYYLVCTDGSKGTEDASLPPERLIPMRQKEQRAAAETVSLIGPKLVIPMHYKTPAAKAKLEPLDRFLKEMGADGALSERQPKLIGTKSTLPEQTKVLVLDYKGQGS